jgi:hypothetical protein
MPAVGRMERERPGGGAVMAQRKGYRHSQETKRKQSASMLRTWAKKKAGVPEA